MTTAAILVLLLVVLPILALRYGAESRNGFGSQIDWRRLDA